MLVSFGIDLVRNAVSSHELDGLLPVVAPERPDTTAFARGKRWVSKSHPVHAIFMSNDLDTNAQHTPTDILIPVLADGTPIIWDGNDAHIEGTVHDVGKY